MEYTSTDLATACGCSNRTFYRRVSILKKSGLFKKTSMGRYYNEPDAELLSKLIGFTLKRANYLAR